MAGLSHIEAPMPRLDGLINDILTAMADAVSEVPGSLSPAAVNANLGSLALQVIAEIASRVNALQIDIVKSTGAPTFRLNPDTLKGAKP